MEPTIDLSKAGNGNFKRKKWSRIRELFWIIIELILITNPLQLSSRLRVLTLKAFGAKIGKNVIMRQRVRIRCPWNLTIGNNCWIGEEVWIINKAELIIGHDTVVSQGVFITTGSHDIYKTMNVKIKPIVIGNGVWITSKCIVLQGVRIEDNTVITAGSVITNDLLSNSIYGGNPIKYIKRRFE
ncbi:hypothetical protein ABE65_019135 [Fictibacillus phosphorivorans]|uniref:Acetyltransferase n=1 Tax=Fictibacillus phosphorivorans TaxID=1221500 RepID=A0A160IR47_9BACL|nr:DapH/DapD/GlmU-related protein [Fictibacillus phosphorivorans]ANC78796.1 hypothetical protein ABE65_019135 [Fictibacillus phosphorivorans]